MSSKKPAAKQGAKPAPKPAGGAKAPAKKPAPAKGAAAKAPAAQPAAPKPAPALPVNEIGLKEITSVLSDKEGKIKESGRYPIVIDEAGRVAVFLQHRDCNMFNILNSTEMASERLRQGLLGAVRYGKPMVINLMEAGGIEVVADFFNEIQPDLMELVLTKKILEEDRYLKLVRPNDDADYQQIFGVGENFTFVFITTNPELTDITKSKTIVFKID